MKNLYECSRCGMVSGDQQQLCRPHVVEGRQSMCGAAPEPGNLYRSQQEILPVVCATCGRPADRAELVFHPAMIG